MRLFDKYSHAIRALPNGPLTERDLLTDDFLIAQEGNLSIYYAPLDRVNRAARAVMAGITPGQTQMRLAFETVRDALAAGYSSDDALRKAKEQAAFAGAMRTRLCDWLDRLGLPAWLGAPNAEALFSTHATLLHSTSVLRYPVFVDDGHNYTGRRPNLSASPFLLDFTRRYFLRELRKLDNPIIVPLGTAVANSLRAVKIDASHCLYGFPHPSGAYVGGPSQFVKEKPRLRRQLTELFA